jgi:hypothetical protein
MGYFAAGTLRAGTVSSFCTDGVDGVQAHSSAPLAVLAPRIRGRLLGSDESGQVSGAARAELAACKTLARERHAAVRASFRSFMVQRDQWDTSWGPKKIIFLIRDIDGPTMTAASMESCRFVVLWSQGGSLGSVVDMCNRLRRMRGRFPLEIHLPRCISGQMSPPQNAMSKLRRVAPCYRCQQQ